MKQNQLWGLRQVSIDAQTPEKDTKESAVQQASKKNLLKIIETEPSLPAILNLGEKLTIKFQYDLGPAEQVQIWARPYTNGRLTRGYRAHGSPFYRRKERQTGEAEGYFHFGDPAVVDEVRIEMKDVASGTTVYSLSEKIDAKWVEKE